MNGLFDVSMAASTPLSRELGIGEARADLAGVPQLTTGVEVADEQRTDPIRAPALTDDPSADHELLAPLVLDLAPRRRATTRLVRGVEPFRHHALEAEVEAGRERRVTVGAV